MKIRLFSIIFILSSALGCRSSEREVGSEGALGYVPANTSEFMVYKPEFVCKALVNKCAGTNEFVDVLWLSDDRRERIEASLSYGYVIEPEFENWYWDDLHERAAYFRNHSGGIVSIDCLPSGISALNLHGRNFNVVDIPKDNALRFVSVRLGEPSRPTLSETFAAFPEIEMMNYSVNNHFEKETEAAFANTNRIEHEFDPVFRAPRLKRFYYKNDVPFCGDVTKCILQLLGVDGLDELGIMIRCVSSNDNSAVDFTTVQRPGIGPDMIHESSDWTYLKVDIGAGDVGAIVWPDVYGKPGCKIQIRSDRLQTLDFGPVLKYPALKWLILDLTNIVPLNMERTLKSGVVKLRLKICKAGKSVR